MTAATDPSDFTLRHRLGLYITIVVLGAVVSIGVILRILAVHDWRLFASLEIGWIMIVVWIFLGMSYKLLWHDGKIVLKVLGKPDVVVAPDEIVSAGMDTEVRAKIAGITRSSARIKISAKAPWDNPKAVYVSLGHFQAPDIKRLMGVISAARPDLAFPREWVQNCDTRGWKP